MINLINLILQKEAKFKKKKRKNFFPFDTNSLLNAIRLKENIAFLSGALGDEKSHLDQLQSDASFSR